MPNRTVTAVSARAAGVIDQVCSPSKFGASTTVGEMLVGQHGVKALYAAVTEF